ncbi:MCE family protein [Nocardioides caeni]|uniref:MCE family protein n=1 Tax=Nocardioides caeni TaxID=574700 RepID=UPI0031ED75D3
MTRSSRPSPYHDEAPGGGTLAKLYTRRSLHLLGILAIGIVISLLALSVAVFTHAFSDPAEIRLDVDRAGSQLAEGADVKLNGIVVGRVSAIESISGGTGAELTLAIDRDRLDLIPANITAQVIPKTIFGEKYVDLGLPREPVATRLADGDVIERDRSSVAIETSTVLNNLAPLLNAVQPADLSTTLTAIATAVQGRGELLGQTITDSQAFTGQLRPSIPAVVDNAALIAEVSDSYLVATDPLLAALDQVGTTARTLTAHERDLQQLLVGTGDFADVTRGFVDAVGETAIDVVEVSRPVLAMLKKYSPEIACFVRGVVRAKERLDAVFAAGPYLKARLYVSVSRGMYEPGVDSPKDIDLSAYGPYCPVLPKGDQLTVPWPDVPKELDQLRGVASPLNHLDGIPGQPSTGDGYDVGELLNLVLGGVLG